MWANKGGSGILAARRIKKQQLKGGIGKAEIHCFYNSEAPLQKPPFTPSNIPIGLCSSVIYCCLVPTSDGRNLSFTTDTGPDVLKDFSTLLSHMEPRLKRYVALGGPRTNYMFLTRALRDASTRNQFIAGILSLFEVKYLASSGLVVHILQPERLGKPSVLNHFIIELSARLKSRLLTISLPVSSGTESRYFHPLSYKGVNRFIKVSHRFGKPSIGNCPNPIRGPQEHSLQKVFRATKSKYRRNWENALRNKTLFTVSLAGYTYWVKNGSLSGITEGRVEKHHLSGYPDICRKLDDANWNHKYIRETGCLTAWSGRSYVSSLSPKSFKFIEGKREMKGVAVFDIEKDDFRGVCGDPYPMLRALRENLNKLR